MTRKRLLAIAGGAFQLLVLAVVAHMAGTVSSLGSTNFNRALGTNFAPIQCYLSGFALAIGFMVCGSYFSYRVNVVENMLAIQEIKYRKLLNPVKPAPA